MAVATGRITKVQRERLRAALEEERNGGPTDPGARASFEAVGRLPGRIDDFAMQEKVLQRLAAAGLIERRPAFDRTKAGAQAKAAVAGITAALEAGDWRAAMTSDWKLRSVIERGRAEAWFLTDAGREEARR